MKRSMLPCLEFDPLKHYPLPQPNLKQPSPALPVIGDLLLLFDDSPPGAPARGEDWQLVKQGASWRLWGSASSSEWRGSPIVTVETGPWCVWLLGEVYSLPADCSSLDLWLSALLDEPKRASELNGHCLLLAWNEGTAQWHLWTNRFGTFHVYHTSGNGGAIGTFFPTVAARSRRALDWEGLNGFFATGFFPQDRTFYEDVRILRPATHYVFVEGGQPLEATRYWHWWHEPDRSRSYDESVEEFAAIWHQVMDAHTRRGRVALPISGGLDSRSTVAALGSPVVPTELADCLFAYSYGYTEDSIETRIAATIAETAQLPFTKFTVGPYLFERLDRVSASLEGFQDVTQARQATVLDSLAAHSDYVIAAHWGDVWFDDMGTVEWKDKADSVERLLDHTIHKLKKRGRAWLLQHLVGPHLKSDPETRLREMVRAEFAAMDGIEDPDFRVKAFKTEQWSFRWTLSSLRMYQAATFPRLPFYDTRIADFFCTVPSAWVRQRQMQVDYLRRYAPALAHITWQPYDANLYNYQHFNTWLLPKRAFKKAQRLLQRNRVIQRNWEIQFLSEEGRRQLEHWLLQLGRQLHEYVAPAAICSLVDHFYAAPDGANGYTVSMLLTFSTWLEHYG